jgi:hypothetical protein
MSRRVQAKGARPTQLVRRALVPLRGPRVVGGYADVATRVGRAPGITLPLSRRAEALQRRAPSPLHPSNVVGPPTPHKLPVGRPRESGGSLLAR